MTSIFLGPTSPAPPVVGPIKRKRSSRYPGVTRRPGGRYAARWKGRWLGEFDTETEAAEAVIRENR